MKKLSVLMAAMMLGGTSVVTYAAPSIDEIIADVAEAMVPEGADGISAVELAEQLANGWEGPAEDADDIDVPDSIFAVPYEVDMSSPKLFKAICPSPPRYIRGAKINGGEMAQFPVTVTFADDTTETVTWDQLGPGSIAGGFFGTDWFVVQLGETWNNIWVLSNNGPVGIKSIKFQASVDLDGNKEVGVFDIIGGRPNPEDKTKGSERGRPLTLFPTVPQQSVPDYVVTYSDPLYARTDYGNVIPEPQPSDHDIFGTMTIDFVDKMKGSLTAPAQMIFLADTDCALDAKITEGNGYICIAGEAEDEVNYTAPDGSQGTITVSQLAGVAESGNKCGTDRGETNTYELSVSKSLGYTVD